MTTTDESYSENKEETSPKICLDIPADYKPPAFQLYAETWLSSRTIRLMSGDVQAAYLRLLCFQWCEADCTLADEDFEELAELEQKSSKSLAQLRRCFPLLQQKPGRRANIKLLEQREDLWMNHKERVESGRLGGKTKAEKRALRVKSHSSPKENSYDFATSKSLAKPSSLSLDSNSNSNSNKEKKKKKRRSSSLSFDDEENQTTPESQNYVLPKKRGEGKPPPWLRPKSEPLIDHPKTDNPYLIFCTKSEWDDLDAIMGMPCAIYIQTLMENYITDPNNQGKGLKWYKKTKDHALAIMSWYRREKAAGKAYHFHSELMTEGFFPLHIINKDGGLQR